MPEDSGKQKEWVTVFSSNRPQDVELARMMLKEEGIVAVLMSKQDSAYKIGEDELYVDRPDVVKSLRILEKLKGNE